MAARGEFIDLLKDFLAGALDVSARRMFSGSGLYADGAIFALVIGETHHTGACLSVFSMTPMRCSSGRRKRSLCGETLNA